MIRTLLLKIVVHWKKDHLDDSDDTDIDGPHGREATNHVGHQCLCHHCHPNDSSSNELLSSAAVP